MRRAPAFQRPVSLAATGLHRAFGAVGCGLNVLRSTADRVARGQRNARSSNREHQNLRTHSTLPYVDETIRQFLQLPPCSVLNKRPSTQRKAPPGRARRGSITQSTEAALAVAAVDGVFGAVGDRVHVPGSATDRVTRGSRQGRAHKSGRYDLLNHTQSLPET